MSRRNSAAVDPAVEAQPIPEVSASVPMELETWPIGRLIPYERNAKKHSPADVDRLAVSLKEFGFRRAFVVEPNGTIIVGHRMRLAALQLGIIEVPVNVARGLSAAKLKALRLADNKLNDSPEYDLAMLGAELLDLNSIGFDLSLTGFDMSEVADVVSGLFTGGMTQQELHDVTFQAASAEKQGRLDQQKITCPNCKHVFVKT